ncbi:class III cytochrome C family protein [Candidatus Methanoperedens nitroreducens]|uniref:Class III cytochrome C family protein n=1 Tax=Candidatus Methanoperedens nitratireducens TaxID=1392998 RepID=A0A062V467_9EURY|nr:cytochrome c3 family protein [Candidatus Methanoperedens nitroreducens]KCZ70604.1 class III cytochrome C family protein [Candidatus Methanoperedens nitroreducens]MDJ1420459.1 cytochrome c3 family protein [Candidatus Methanoperedens sp.]
MRTLLENITFIKGVEYLIIVAFCFGFIALWLLVHTKEKEAMRRVVSVVIPMSLIFGGAAIVLATYFNPEATDTSAVPGSVLPEHYSNYNNYSNYSNYSNGSPAATYGQDGWLNVNNSEYLEINYGSATKFHQEMSGKLSCQECHHNSKDEIRACSDCHERPFDPQNSSKPGLKAAYHQQCMSCHSDVFDGPESCTFCHTKDASTNIQASARPHQLTWENCSNCHKDGIPGGQETKIVYHDNCLKCHTKEIAGAAKVPADHAGRDSNTCQGCHKPGGG